ncbi:hypothetical protein AOLI_G00123770 [Acnodon oligacanthus]
MGHYSAVQPKTTHPLQSVATQSAAAFGIQPSLAGWTPERVFCTHINLRDCAGKVNTADGTEMTEPALLVSRCHCCVPGQHGGVSDPDGSMQKMFASELL